MRARSRISSRSVLQLLVSVLASVRFTAILLAILIPATIVGTLIPQGRPPLEYVGLYGWNWFRIFHFLWLTNIFTSFWYIALLLVLGVNVLVCTGEKLMERTRQLGFFITHLSLLLLIGGGLVSALGRVRGEVRIVEGETVDSFTSGAHKIPLGFELRLKDFELQQYRNQGEQLIVHVLNPDASHTFFFQPETWTVIPGTALQFRVEHFVPDFRSDPATGRVFSASNEPRNPAIYVHVAGDAIDYGEWVFHRFPHVHDRVDQPLQLAYQWSASVPKDFISHVEVLEKGKVVLKKSIEVNHPLRYGGFAIYQASYDSVNKQWSGLAVVKDPGVWIVYAGIILLMIGLTRNIYVRALLAPNNNHHH